MAIKLPDPGNGIPEQKTGNDEWTNMKIVRENFADQSNAASRLVGIGNGQIPTANQAWEAASGKLTWQAATGKNLQVDNLTAGTKYYAYHSEFDAGPNSPFLVEKPARWFVSTYEVSDEFALQEAVSSSGTVMYRARMWGVWNNNGAWVKGYNTGNTTKDTATGFLKASSPVLHVYNDSITKIHEAEQLDITVDKKGVGHYEIHGTTGLRKNDGWFMSPPRDVHGNVLCMVDLEEKDGVVILRTYKKKFDFETVSIVHDYDNPIDIPGGVCVEFRFNDLPEEQLDEPIE